jgi:WXXGXW repeat (2 copies)
MKATHLLVRPSRRLILCAALASALAIGTVDVLAPHQAQAGVSVSVNFAPPLLPVYAQPAIPGPGYLWTPGYWAYDAVGGYYWVPGTWVQPPYVGALWTPGYWGWSGSVFAFHEGYWGVHVGYYGGINYGFGYGGVGYLGGYWHGGGFYYNRSVNNITNIHVTNVYTRNVVNTTASNASFNGPGGLSARPTAQELAYQRESHTAPVAAQVAHRTEASHIEGLRATVNHGSPSIAATPTPRAFGSAAVTARPSTSAATPRATTGSTVNGTRSSTYAPHANSSASTSRTSDTNPVSHNASAQSSGANLRSTTYAPSTTTAHTTNAARSGSVSSGTSSGNARVTSTGVDPGRAPATTNRVTSSGTTHVQNHPTATTHLNSDGSTHVSSSTTHATTTPHAYATQVHQPKPPVAHSNVAPSHGRTSTDKDKDKDDKPERH